MSFLRRASLGTLRNLRPKASGHDGEGFFTEGKQTKLQGNLFCETPPPPGQKRKWESWEFPWYFSMTAAALILFVGVPSRPDSSLVTWAHKEAQKRLKAQEG